MSVVRAAQALRAGLAPLRRAAAWWWGELAAMLPARWTGRDEGGERLIACPDPTGYRLAWSGPRGEVTLDPAERPAVPPLLVLPAGAGLIRRLDLPALPPADLRRLIRLDLDRLTPFPPELALADLEVEGGGDRRTRVVVGVVRRDRAEAALAEAAAAGLDPVGLALRDEDGAVRFDFLSDLPAARRPARRGWRAVRPGLLWGLAGGLALAGLLAGAWRDQAEIDGLRRQAEALRPQAAAARALRESLATETERRLRLRARQQESDPLALLAALTAALPDDIWVQRLEWDGAGLRLAGGAAGGEAAVLTALAAVPAFRAARAEAATLAATPGRLPFAVTIDRVGVIAGRGGGGGDGR